jgi:hypothetical protein
VGQSSTKWREVVEEKKEKVPSVKAKSAKESAKGKTLRHFQSLYGPEEGAKRAEEYFKKQKL